MLSGFTTAAASDTAVEPVLAAHVSIVLGQYLHASMIRQSGPSSHSGLCESRLTGALLRQPLRRGDSGLTLRAEYRSGWLHRMS